MYISIWCNLFNRWLGRERWERIVHDRNTCIQISESELDSRCDIVPWWFILLNVLVIWLNYALQHGETAESCWEYFVPQQTSLFILNTNYFLVPILINERHYLTYWWWRSHQFRLKQYLSILNFAVIHADNCHHLLF